jgi:hypothetical protein
MKKKNKIIILLLIFVITIIPLSYIFYSYTWGNNGNLSVNLSDPIYNNDHTMITFHIKIINSGNNNIRILPELRVGDLLEIYDHNNTVIYWGYPEQEWPIHYDFNLKTLSPKGSITKSVFVYFNSDYFIKNITYLAKGFYQVVESKYITLPYFNEKISSESKEIIW